MALLRVDFFSESLEMGTSMTVLLPQAGEAQIGVSGSVGTGEVPVLYLLHGLSDDATAWTRFTSVERYAAQRGLAVVMPQVARSFYADEAHGQRYWTFLSEELPTVVSSFFRVSTAREDTFVAGLSMGGYGAAVWALRHPDRFAAVATMSGALDLHLLATRGDLHPLYRQVFDGRPSARDDPFELLRATDPATAPAMHVSCGTEDELVDANRRFVDLARGRGLDVTVDLRPGVHDWTFWDRELQDILAWLPVRG